MGCDDCREAISAELDGEGSPDERTAIAAHLDGCADCRMFADRAAYVTRLTRTRPVEAVPDLVASVLAVAPPPRRRYRAEVLRLMLGAVGIGQFALAVSGVAGAHTGSHLGGVELAGASVAHLANESSAWNLALSVAFLWVAAGSSRVSGLVPVIGAFVTVLTVLSAMDAVGGRVDAGRLVTHGLVVVGFVLLLAVQRTEAGGGGSAGALPAPDGQQSGGRTGWPIPRRADPDDGLQPTARHRAA